MQPSKLESRPHDDLCRYVEGSLPETSDRAMEMHLQGCSRCATYADGYAAFLAAFDAEADSTEMLGTVERLDARMKEVCRDPDFASKLVDRTQQVFALGEVIPIASERLRSAAREHPYWGLTEPPPDGPTVAE